MIKFGHLEFTEEEFKKQHLKIMTIMKATKIISEIHDWNMKTHHSSYNPVAVWQDMQERCIIHTVGNKVLMSEKIFKEMLKIYKKKFSDGMSFWHIKKFNPIMAMFMRNQVSEC